MGGAGLGSGAISHFSELALRDSSEILESASGKNTQNEILATSSRVKYLSHLVQRNPRIFFIWQMEPLSPLSHNFLFLLHQLLTISFHSLSL